jgi:protein-S-isoprenylcysteine O-methyltransferase
VLGDAERWSAFGRVDVGFQVALTIFVVGVLADAIVGRRHVFGTTRSDQGSYWFIQLAQLAALVLGLTARDWASALDIPRGLWPLGALVMVAGIVIRLWAVRTLGRWFSREVQVSRDQQVVTSGPYRWVRHPSYTGALLLFGGLGIAMTNVVSIAALIVVPLPAYLRRIQIEEHALFAALGDDYRAYAVGRPRLLPHV